MRSAATPAPTHMVETVSRREFAKICGVSDKTVRDWIKAGRIPIEDDDRIDPDRAAEMLAATDQRTNTPRKAPRTSEADVEPKSNKPTLVQAQTAKVITEARIQGLKLAEMEGELVRKSEIQKAIISFAQTYRDQLIALPARVGAQFAADLQAQGTDTRVVIMLLEKYVREYLSELSRVRSPEL